MNIEEARAIAERFLATQGMRGFKAVFEEAHKSKTCLDSWAVSFQLYAPEGGLVDGGLLIIVDEATGKARVLTPY
jgi:hypothetical protein